MTNTPGSKGNEEPKDGGRDLTVKDVTINKNTLRGKIEVNAEIEELNANKHGGCDYMFPYDRFTGELQKLRMPSYKDSYKVKPWSRAVDLVPQEVWGELDEQGYNISNAKKAYKEKYGGELL